MYLRQSIPRAEAAGLAIAGFPGQRRTARSLRCDPWQDDEQDNEQNDSQNDGADGRQVEDAPREDDDHLDPAACGERDPLGDFGLDDEEAQPEPGDFWIDPEDGLDPWN